MRYSLSWLFCATALSAFSIAAVVNPHQLWLLATRTILYLFLCIAATGVFVCRERAQAMWIGAAVFSWTYTVLAIDGFLPTTISYSMPWYTANLLMRWVIDDRELTGGSIGEAMFNLENTVEALWAIYFGIIGSLIACWMYARREQHQVER